MGRGDFSFEVRGTNRVANKLRTLAAQMPTITNKSLYQWADDTRKELKGTKYPPKRPGQKYKRTGRLANSWKVDRAQKKVDIINTASSKGKKYAGYVIGDNQAWMHKNRWWRASDVIKKQIPALTKLLSNELRKEIDK